MTETPTLEFEFDPAWPHGHECILGDGTRIPAKIRISDLAGAHPIAAEVNSHLGKGRAETWLFAHDGTCGPARLVNKPVPLPTVRDVRLCYVMFDDRAETKAKVVLELLSDGSRRATAEIVK